MVLTDILKFLEPTTLEVKALFSNMVGGLGAYPLLENASFSLAIGSLSTLPLYVCFRIAEYKLRNEKLTKPNRPQKVISEYLGGIRFDNWQEQLPKEEFEKIIKKPVEEKPEQLTPEFYLERARILYRLR